MFLPSRRILAAAAGAIVVAIVVFALTAVAAVRHNRDTVDRPQLSVAVDRTLRYVGPYLFCDDVAKRQCDPQRTPADIPVEAGQSIIVSLPDYISKRPWDVSVQYLYPNGNSTITSTPHLTPGESLIILKSTRQAMVAQIELHVPSAVQDTFGNLISQAVWAIDTLPPGYAPESQRS
ncbi:DUF2771 family protein [Tsukamurella soli]|uniref:DUF2771 domain-containing protein n=1 Tax=Tsukamurella soli TaxID=644556 RepID=A0ABP8KFV4_9ACTN